MHLMLHFPYFYRSQKKQNKMKKLMLLFAAFLMIGFAANAQTTTAPAQQTTKKQVQNPAAYACPKCFKITKEGGKCSVDGTDMVQLGTYYCLHCMKSTGTKPGKCPTCGMATTQITRKYCAAHGGTPLKDKQPKAAPAAAQG
jgi:hypothetical protein